MLGVTKTGPKLIVHDWRLKKKGDTFARQIGVSLTPRDGLLVGGASATSVHGQGAVVGLLASPNVTSRRNSGALRDGAAGVGSW